MYNDKNCWGVDMLKLDKNLFKETAIKKQRIYKGRSVDFYNDKIRLPNKKTAWREYLAHPGAIAVLGFLDSQRIVMVKQYRYPVAEATLEIPAGKMDGRESPILCAKREMEEETGYVPSQLSKLVSYWPTPAFSNEVLHVYVARKLTLSRMNPDDDEFLEPVIVPYQKALALVKTGKIRDSKTVIALCAYQAFQKT